MAVPIPIRRFYVARWMVGGALFGTALLLIAWRIGIAVSGSLTFGELHSLHPMMWIIDMLPTILGLAGGAVGVLHLRLTQSRLRTEENARRIAAAWTSDLHDANLEMAKALEERQRFYAAFSHEMRSPLSSIVGYSELVDQAQIQPPELSDYVAEIYGSARVLLDMVNDLLDAAKLELGGVQVQLEDVDGGAIAAEVVRRLLPLAGQKGLEIVTIAEQPIEARADSQRLRQVLTNLISNAIKYSDKGTISVRTGSLDAERAFFSVTDQGSGIDADDLERIFEPFAQADNAKGRTDSSGLGLTVSKTLVAAMDGELTVSSPGVGQGSEFTVTLPLGNGTAAETRTASLSNVSA